MFCLRPAFSKIWGLKVGLCEQGKPSYTINCGVNILSQLGGFGRLGGVCVMVEALTATDCSAGQLWVELYPFLLL